MTWSTASIQEWKPSVSALKKSSEREAKRVSRPKPRCNSPIPQSWFVFEGGGWGWEISRSVSPTQRTHKGVPVIHTAATSRHHTEKSHSGFTDVRIQLAKRLRQ